MSKRIKGILFDIGETLLDFGEPDVHSMFEAGARLAYEFLKKLNYPVPTFAAYHRKQLWAIRWAYFKSRFTRREFNSLDLINRIGRRMGHKVTPEQSFELAWLWYEPLSKCATVEKGVLEMLARLKEAGLRMGLGSNRFIPGEVLDRHLESEGLLDLLPIRVYSCDVGYRKPDSRIFNIALKRASLTPAETLFIGDSVTADICGANRAGLMSVLKDPVGHYADSSANPRYRIRSLTEIEALVADYNSGAGREQPL